uniref:SDR family NAD(P)-dependent oxidoreductase n=1 Tax=Enterocloster clostridioformis TaxID=1531 RepID=UPI000A3ECFF1|nr:SDR family oxidoreductase [Enterocloster clostridioformis]
MFRDSREKVLEALHCPNLSTEKDVLCVIADLTHEEAVKAAMEQIDRHFGRIDGLVNAAGMNIIESLEKLTLSDFQKVMDTNFTSVAICCKYAGVSSKAAVDSLTRALAIEWAQQDINVNSVAPGMIVTDINRKQIEENPRSYEKRIESIPRGCAGRTEWLVAPVIMLLSPGSVHMTGQTVFVDGGCTAGDTFVMETERFR